MRAWILDMGAWAAQSAGSWLAGMSHLAGALLDDDRDRVIAALDRIDQADDISLMMLVVALTAIYAAVWYGHWPLTRNWAAKMQVLADREQSPHIQLQVDHGEGRRDPAAKEALLRAMARSKKAGYPLFVPMIEAALADFSS